MTSFTPSQRVVCVAGFAAVLALMTGCASPGPPRPPSLHLPNPVTDLTAERHGNSVVLRFSTPEKTTDSQPVVGAVSASLCRAVGQGTCVATSSFPGKTTVSGAVKWVDVLPPELVAGPANAVAYRVTIFNESGRSAGPSEPVLAAAGEAPLRVETLRAEGSRDGIVLHWTVESQPTGEVLVKREALDASGLPKKQAEPSKKTLLAPKAVGVRKGHGAQAKSGEGAAEDEGATWLRAEAGSGEHDSGGMVDGTASADTTYRYMAVRSRNVMLDGRKVELRSEASAPVIFAMRDVYPPASPQGLLAAGFPVEGTEGIGVDLVWRPNVESDLAGYNVYRQVLAADGSATGPKVKRNEKLVTLPAFHDAAAMRGVGYRYSVTAVDAKGNESAASEPALLSATP